MMKNIAALACIFLVGCGAGIPEERFHTCVKSCVQFGGAKDIFIVCGATTGLEALKCNCNDGTSIYPEEFNRELPVK